MAETHFSIDLATGAQAKSSLATLALNEKWLYTASPIVNISIMTCYCPLLWIKVFRFGLLTPWTGVMIAEYSFILIVMMSIP